MTRPVDSLEPAPLRRLLHLLSSMSESLSSNEFRELATLLRRRLEIIADHSWRDRDGDSHLEALKTVSESVLAWHGDRQGQLDPRLDHFLTRGSYEKAIAWLEDELKS